MLNLGNYFSPLAYAYPDFQHKSMLGNCKMLLERDGGGYIAINPKFDKLITSLRTAVENEGMLDKEATSYDYVFDAFRLALRFVIG